MFNQLKEALKGLVSVMTELPLGKKVALASVALFMLVGILLTAYLSSGETYSVLYSNLSQEDALAVTEKLKERNVPSKLTAGGTVISVPNQDVYQLRLELAGEGIPSGGGVGFELFDKSTFGMTEFIQNLNYRRALQGELSRTINSISPIKSSRVHISIPKRELFDDSGSKASASVVLKIRGNRRLAQGQIDSILHLVASSVDMLAPNQITIVDGKGNLLSAPEDGDELTKLTNKQLGHRQAVEASMEKRVRTMLERTIGRGKVVVRVNAKINFKQSQSTQEIFDPNSQVSRSEQRTEEKSVGEALPSGVAGVQSNIPGVIKNQPVMSKPAQSTKVNETTNYEINKTVKTTIEPTAVLTQLSVAVLVDGKYTTTKNEDGTTTRVFAPISAEDKTRLESLVRSAIGYDDARQDKVTIESMQFNDSALYGDAATGGLAEDSQFISDMVAYGGLALLGIILFLFVIRPIMGWVTKSADEVGELRTFPRTLQEMEAELGKITTEEEVEVDFTERVSQLVAENPEAAANLVRSWLRARG